MEIVDNKLLLFKTRNPHKYSIIPRHKVMPRPGGGYDVAVYWSLDEARVLKNLGVKDVPSPIYGKYGWPGRYTPMAHQKETASFLTLHRRAFVLSEPGTGKTISALWAADYLMKRGEVRRCLILCPLSIMHSAWMQDISNSVIHRSAVVAHHPQASRRIEIVQQGFEFVIINYEGLSLIANEIKNDERFDLIIVDECFVAGTLVATPQGRRPIEKLEAGDKVLTSDGVMRINKLVRNTTKKLVEISLGNGKTVRCTPEHPFFTDAGWVCAKNLAGRRLISGVELSCLRAGISPRAFPGAVGYGEQPTPWLNLLKILRTEEVALSESQQELLLQHAARAAGQSHGAEDCRTSGQVVSDSESNRAQAPCEGRERQGNGSSRAVDFRGLACGLDMELPSSVGQEAARLSYELQARLRVAAPQSGVGSGWQQPHSSGSTSTGSQEGSEAGDAWVVGVSHIECPDGETVYNLEVEGTPNYFVGDHWLVHNCNAYKNPSTQRWKALNSILKPQTYLWMMTGTPASQSPADAYGLARLVNPAGVPKFQTAWRDMVMNKVTMFKWVPKIDAAEKVHKALQPAIRYTKEQCLDLPPVITMTREVPLTPQQAKYYNMLKTQMLVQAAGETITAVNAAAALNKLLQISCIAYNTPVLTQDGWVPIQAVRDDDLVWDGVEFVRHKGLLMRGRKRTIDCFGVRMTPDHEVLTNAGWRTAEESVGFDRANVRLPDSAVTQRYERWENAEGSVVMPVRLRQYRGSREPVLAHKAPSDPKALWVPARKQNARNDGYASVSDMEQHASALLKSVRQGLAQLRRAWDNSVSRMGAELRRILGRHVQYVPTNAFVGTNGQLWALQPGELPVGNSFRAVEQHPQYRMAGYAERAYDTGASCRSLRTTISDTKCATEQIRLAAGESVTDSGTEEVFDIASCGPRNRFVVRGADGQALIVHNCGVAYTDNKEVVEFDSTPRLNVLLEALEQTERKVIVFALFRAAIDSIAQFLTKRGIACEEIHGGVTATKRGDIINRFQTQPNPRVLVMQPAAAAHGITLTAADTVIFYGPLMSVEQYVQACARADRKGQNAEKVTVIHIQGSPIERKMFKALEGKVNDQSMLVSLFNAEIKERGLSKEPTLV